MLNFVAFGDGGQAHANATLIFVKSITLTGVIFDIIVTIQLLYTDYCRKHVGYRLGKKFLSYLLLSLVCK